MSKEQSIIDVLLIGRTKKLLGYLVVKRTEAGHIKKSEIVSGKKEWALQAAQLVRLKWLAGDE